MMDINGVFNAPDQRNSTPFNINRPCRRNHPAMSRPVCCLAVANLVAKPVLTVLLTGKNLLLWWRYWFVGGRPNLCGYVWLANVAGLPIGRSGCRAGQRGDAGASPDCFPGRVSSLAISISGWPRILPVHLESSFLRWRCAVRVNGMENLLLVAAGHCPPAQGSAAAPSISERSAQVSGVEVALDPFVESGRTKEYFDMDAVANGIAILHVRVTNKTVDQTFLVEKKGFQLLRNGGGALTDDGKSIEHSQASANALGITGAVLGGLGGTGLLLAGSAMVSHSTEIQRNLTSKEMGDQTLSPGESMEGFIYFMPVNRGEDWTQGATVKINLTETKSQKLTELNVPLSIK